MVAELRPTDPFLGLDVHGVLELGVLKVNRKSLKGHIPLRVRMGSFLMNITSRTLRRTSSSPLHSILYFGKYKISHIDV